MSDLVPVPVAVGDRLAVEVVDFQGVGLVALRLLDGPAAGTVVPAQLSGIEVQPGYERAVRAHRQQQLGEPGGEQVRWQAVVVGWKDGLVGVCLSRPGLGELDVAPVAAGWAVPSDAGLQAGETGTALRFALLQAARRQQGVWADQDVAPSLRAVVGQRVGDDALAQTRPGWVQEHPLLTLLALGFLLVGILTRQRTAAAPAGPRPGRLRRVAGWLVRQHAGWLVPQGVRPRRAAPDPLHGAGGQQSEDQTKGER